MPARRHTGTGCSGRWSCQRSISRWQDEGKSDVDHDAARSSSHVSETESRAGRRDERRGASHPLPKCYLCMVERRTLQGGQHRVDSTRPPRVLPSPETARPRNDCDDGAPGPRLPAHEERAGRLAERPSASAVPGPPMSLRRRLERKLNAYCRRGFSSGCQRCVSRSKGIEWPHVQSHGEDPQLAPPRQEVLASPGRRKRAREAAQGSRLA
jgi:hypothetical protein